MDWWGAVGQGVGLSPPIPAIVCPWLRIFWRESSGANLLARRFWRGASGAALLARRFWRGASGAALLARRFWRGASGAALLARRFWPEEVGQPNRFWCGDITYLPTREGWLYLAMVKDLFSRRIVGWALGETMEATLVETAWQRARQTRGFAPDQGPELYHSDRGSQYAGHLFQNLLASSNTQASMSSA